MTVCYKHFPNCKIIIQKPIWYSPNTYNGAMYLAGRTDRLQSYFPQIDKLARSIRMPIQGMCLPLITRHLTYFNEHYRTDLMPEQGHQGIFYLHPNEKGAGVLGNFWAEAIYQYRQKD